MLADRSFSACDARAGRRGFPFPVSVELVPLIACFHAVERPSDGKFRWLQIGVQRNDFEFCLCTFGNNPIKNRSDADHVTLRRDGLCDVSFDRTP